nr:hypothetical protein [uncultured Dongia sp.]
MSATTPLARPELTKAIQDITAKARKQFAETGDLAGFSSEYKSESGDSTITLKISAMATALYDKTAKEDAFVLQYRLASQDDAGASSGSGTTLTIRNEADIDNFARNLIATTNRRGTSTDSSDTIKALVDSLQPKAPVSEEGAPEEGAPAEAPDSEATPVTRFEALQKQQQETAGVVRALSAFVTGLKELYQPQYGYRSGVLDTGQDATKGLRLLLDIRA